ncbi:unnamed protein product [Linum tenue]|uniref:25S rRNA (uridine-N(3))-methyltransferase BMT5-like domain-containing protein n=1 Tax=Linum tenue TaxID=586396 RepID=A0AAV0S7D4_9ROSI|nr:unnamed protein product [Linum tenue]
MGHILSCFLRCLCGGRRKDRDDEEIARPKSVQQGENPLPPTATIIEDVNLRDALLTSISNGDGELQQYGLLVALETPQVPKHFVLFPGSSTPPNPPCSNVDPSTEAPLSMQDGLGDSSIGRQRGDSVTIDFDQLVHMKKGQGRSYDQVCVDISAFKQAELNSRQEVKLKLCEVKEVWKKHYCSRHKILLVGEGDFSFSASLALAFGTAAFNIVATSLNSQEFLSKNYSKAMANIAGLRARGCLVMHGLDATKMADHVLLKGMKFDRVVFNFPHAGFYPAESTNSQIRFVKRHQKLIRLFFMNAKKLLKEDGGEVHITHKTNAFHREWDLEGLASVTGLMLVAREKFNFIEYPGYKTKYGFGGDNNFNCNPSSTYRFQVQKTAT